MPVDDRLRPAFCQECFCEKCFRGFYPNLGAALPLPSGEYRCLCAGCVGQVDFNPQLRWRRLRPCKDGCARLKHAGRAA